MQPVYPFSAIVGQEMLQRGLLLGVIQPALGGVLVRGTKGVAKSTAVRALARLLPPIETLAGCPFQRCPGEIIPGWPLADAMVVSRPVPLVELPLGASEDRVLGSIHLERALRGERVFEPGLLAAANRGILYIDEVNLLPDHLVDVLLDAAAGGIHRLERDGLSVVHPARFLLIGTMNPEEGELRPELLDRFGLAVDVSDLADLRHRSEAVRRRLDFEADPAGFTDRWQPADALLARRIVDARRLLPLVTINDELVASIGQHCLAAGVDGLRADLTVARAACAWAAFHGRLEVEASDIDAVADLALAHRRRDPPRTPPDRRAGDHEHRRDNHGADSVDVTFSGNAPSQGTRSEITIDDIAGVYEAAVRPPPLSDSVIPGRNRDAGTCPGYPGSRLELRPPPKDAAPVHRPARKLSPRRPGRSTTIPTEHR